MPGIRCNIQTSDCFKVAIERPPPLRPWFRLVIEKRLFAPLNIPQSPPEFKKIAAPLTLPVFSTKNIPKLILHLLPEPLRFR